MAKLHNLQTRASAEQCRIIGYGAGFKLGRGNFLYLADTAVAGSLPFLGKFPCNRRKLNSASFPLIHPPQLHVLSWFWSLSNAIERRMLRPPLFLMQLPLERARSPGGLHENLKGSTTKGFSQEESVNLHSLQCSWLIVLPFPMGFSHWLSFYIAPSLTPLLFAIFLCLALFSAFSSHCLQFYLLFIFPILLFVFVPFSPSFPPFSLFARFSSPLYFCLQSRFFFYLTLIFSLFSILLLLLFFSSSFHY